MPKVLVVDDEHSQAEVLTMLLTLEGFDVVVASNGREALVQLERENPDLILTDYMMPLMNGGEMAKLVRSSPKHARLPIVMTSANEASQIEQHSAHYDVYVRKPYLWEEMFPIIQRLLAR